MCAKYVHIVKRYTAVITIATASTLLPELIDFSFLRFYFSKKNTTQIECIKKYCINLP